MHISLTLPGDLSVVRDFPSHDDPGFKVPLLPLGPAELDPALAVRLQKERVPHLQLRWVVLLVRQTQNSTMSNALALRDEHAPFEGHNKW